MPLPYTDESAIISGIVSALGPLLNNILNSNNIYYGGYSWGGYGNFAREDTLEQFRSEMDASQQLLKQCIDLFKTQNLLSHDSLLLYLKQILGSDADHLAGHTTASLWTHIAHLHNRHEHGEDDIHNAIDKSLQPLGNDYGPDNPHGGWEGFFFNQRAGVLVQEFFSGEDFDRGGGNDSSIPANSSVYGHADGFMLNDSLDDFPYMLDGVHAHPRFAFPPIIISYTDYKLTLGN